MTAIQIQTPTYFLAITRMIHLPLPSPLSSSEGDAGAGPQPGPAADPPARGDPPAQGGAGVPPPQGDAGRRHVRAGGVRRGVGPAVRHPPEGGLRPVHSAQTPGPHQDEHQLQTLLTVLKPQPSLTLVRALRSPHPLMLVIRAISLHRRCDSVTSSCQWVDIKTLLMCAPWPDMHEEASWGTRPQCQHTFL